MVRIEAASVTKRYGSDRGIDDVTFRVRSGEAFGVLGTDGSGKTTLVRTLMGGVRPDSGSIAIAGHSLRDRSERRDMKLAVGFCPAELSFDGDKTGQQLLSEHGQLKGDDRADEFCARLGLDAVLGLPIQDYDDCQRRMLSVVLAFMHDPSVVIMDEPFAGLDPASRTRLRSVLSEERDRGTSLLVATASLEVASQLCDRVAVLRNGHLVDIRPAASLPPSGGRLVRFLTTEAIDWSAFDDVAQRATTGEPGSATEPVSVELLYTGPLDQLCAQLSHVPLQELTIEPPSLQSMLDLWYGVRLTASGGEQGA